MKSSSQCLIEATRTNGEYLLGNQDGHLEKVSYARVAKQAYQYLATLQALGIERGSIVILKSNSRIDFVSILWACILGDLIALPLETEADRTEAGSRILENILARIECHHKIYIIDNNESRTTDALRKHPVNAVWISLNNIWPSGLKSPSAHSSSSSAPRILIPTSGTTGEPSLVELSDQAVRARWWPDISTIRSNVIYLSWAPLNHTMGLAGCSPNARKKIVIHPTEFTKDPVVWLRIASQHRVTHCSMTNFGMRLIINAVKQAGYSTLKQIDLTSIQIIGLGAEALQHDVLSAFTELLDELGVKRESYAQGYGLTECGPVISGRIYSQAFNGESYSLKFSELMLGHEVRIKTSLRERFTDDSSVGEIQVRGPSMATKYYGDTEGTERLISHDGWINTGDLGRLVDGQLELTGRLKETVILNAIKYPSRMIESIAEEVDGVEHAYAFQPAGALYSSSSNNGYQLFVCTSMPDSFNLELAGKVTNRLGSVMGATPGSLFFVSEQEIPRTPLGKVKRHELAKKIENSRRFSMSVTSRNDQYPIDDGSQPTSIRYLFGLWRQVLGHSRFNQRTNFFECGGDSLNAGQLLVKIEDWLERSIPLGDLFRFNTIESQNKSIVCGNLESYPGLPAYSENNLGEQVIRHRQLELMRNWPGYRKNKCSLVVSWHNNKDFDSRKQPKLFWCFQGAHEFQRLAEEVEGEICLYGMRSGHLSFDNNDHNIDSLATVFAREMRELNPSGSFILGGNCQGARIMRRVAELLTYYGRHVQRLILMEERELIPYKCSAVSVVFGTESEFNPYRHQSHHLVHSRLTESYLKGYTYSEIPGSHGRFFNPLHVTSLGRIVKTICSQKDRTATTVGLDQNRRLMACIVISVGDPPYVIDAVQSLLSQVPQPEVLVVSTGGQSPQKRLEAAGISVPVIHRKWRRFVGTARNIGIEATTAPYISYLADDCIAKPDWVSERLRFHLEGAAAVSSALLPSRPDRYWAWINHILLYCRRLPGTPADQTVHYGMSYERSVFRSYGYFREDLRVGEDTDYLTRIGRDLNLTWGSSVVTAHRHPTNFLGFLRDRFKRGRQYESSWSYFSWTDRRQGLASWRRVTSTGISDRISLAKLALAKQDLWVLRFAKHAMKIGQVGFNTGRFYQRFIGGQTNQGRSQKETDEQPVIHALLRFRNESKYLPGYFRHLKDKVDGVIALDDGSSDGSFEFVQSQPLLLEIIRKPNRVNHTWDEPGDRRRLVETARSHGADWFIVLDADERLEVNFRSRLLPVLRKAHLRTEWGLGMRLLECWDSWDHVRVDGLWGSKTVPRLFASRYDHQFDDRELHGSWIPLNANQRSTPVIDIIIYHLRMINKSDRALRQQRYRKLDPARRYQSAGYDYLYDASIAVTQPLEQGRHIQASDTF